VTTFVETGTILDRILRRTAADVAERKSTVSVAELERLASERLVSASLKQALSGPELTVIAEFKRASPSKGRFPFEATPVEVARDYFAGGAAAMSVLTDEPFFQGSLADMEAVAEFAHGLVRPRPVLRKDFVIDSFQLIEAKAHGADAVLLIVAALEQVFLTTLLAETETIGLDALVEVHDREEMARAIDAGASIIGINNRDLRTFQVDLAVTEVLAPLAPAGAVVVGESGIYTRADAHRLQRAGANAVLVGESLVTAPDRAAAVQAIISEGSA
jgi:indole-3-glycerol phosphate synthase